MVFEVVKDAAEHLLARMDAAQDAKQLGSHSEKLLQLVELLVQSLNLGHVAYLEELLKLQLRQALAAGGRISGWKLIL